MPHTWSALSILAFGLSAVAALADGQRPATAEIGSRTFLVGDVPWQHEVEEDYLGISGVPWIKEIFKNDPVTAPRRVVLYLSDKRPSLFDMVEQNWMNYDFGNTELVPEELRIDGLHIEVNPEHPQPFASYAYSDDSDDPTWISYCNFPLPYDGAAERLSYCLMTTGYQPDQDIKVGVRIYGPPPLSDLGTAFPALAERVAKILTCLDVTDDIPATPAEGHARLARLRAENPELRDCHPDLSS